LDGWMDRELHGCVEGRTGMGGKEGGITGGRRGEERRNEQRNK